MFISEYNAPDDFVCVWQKEAKSSLSANGVIGGNKISTEKLFVLKGQEEKIKKSYQNTLSFETEQ